LKATGRILADQMITNQPARNSRRCAVSSYLMRNNSMEWKIPLSDVDFGNEEKNAVIDVLESKWLTMGAVTQQFEREIAAYTGAKHAIAVSNGTAALHLACLAIGLKHGDEAIVPSLTFVATANAVRYTGASPVFADIHSESDLTIDPESITRNITNKTRAILVMHYGGYACDMPKIMQIAQEYGLHVIEDAAHAIGSYLLLQLLFEQEPDHRGRRNACDR
jgi:dTDP-4-amino-4,6-dideoxygalactose transaminase